MPGFQFDLLGGFSDRMNHAVFSRKGGYSKPPFDSLNISYSVNDDENDVKKNRAAICSNLKIDPPNLVTARQTHSKNILVVDETFMSQRHKYDEPDNIDGLITRLKGIMLMVKVADCQAILMFDPVKNAIAAVHAGWRGLVQDISGEAINALKEIYGTDPADLIVGISPSLGPCCSFFSNPETELPPDFKPFTDTRKRVDQWAYSIKQIERHGVHEKNIELAGVCTMCGGGGDFYSFRAQRGITGRFGAGILLS